MPRLLLDLGGMAAQRPASSPEWCHQQATLVQQQNARAASACLAFDPWPILGQPAGDLAVIAFTGDAAGQLGRVPPLPQPVAQVIGTEVDIELLLDEQAETWGSPRLGGEAVIGRVIHQPAVDDLLLGGRQLGWTTRGRSRRRACRATLLGGGKPAADTAGIDAEEISNFLGGVPLGHALDSEKPPALQFSGCAYGPHTGQRCNSQAEVALLF